MASLRSQRNFPQEFSRSVKNKIMNFRGLIKRYCRFYKTVDLRDRGEDRGVSMQPPLKPVIWQKTVLKSMWIPKISKQGGVHR